MNNAHKSSSFILSYQLFDVPRPAQKNAALAQYQKEVQSWKEQFLRISADFENYKKRIAKEQVSWMDTGQMQVLNKLLDIIDNFDRALAQIEKQEQLHQTKALFEGFMLIHKELYKLLDAFQVKEIDAHGEFNPEKHEALVQVDAPDQTSGNIVAVLQKGFMFKDKVLRPAKVSVAR